METNVVAVLDAVPAYRCGIARLLVDGGYEVREAVDASELWDMGDADAIVLTVRTPSDYAVVQTCTARLGSPIVALVASQSCGAFVAALQSGAHCAAPLDAPTRAICAMVDASIERFACIPLHMLNPTVSAFVDQSDEIMLSEQDIALLQRISEGNTIASIARDEGFSVRTMHRRLRELYRRVGVQTREEAIRVLRARGYISSPFAMSLNANFSVQ